MTAIANELLLIVLLILLNGVLAMSEMALVSSRRSRLRARAEGGDAGAQAALRLAEDPTRFLSTVQIGITAVGILAGAFGGANVATQIAAGVASVPALAPYSEAIGLAVVVAFITFLSLILGELVPKRIALGNPEAIAALVARPVGALSRLASPLVAVLSGTTGLVLRLLRVRPEAETAVTEDEIRLMLAEGARAGVLDEGEREIVESVFALGEQRVAALMTPRPRVSWLDIADPPDAQWAELRRAPHHYYPVCRGELDDVVGILSLSDLVPALVDGARPDIASLLRAPTFVPEGLQAFKALEVFRGGGQQVALVIDEHGGVVGLLTPTDVLEALVGDLTVAEEGPVARPDGSWLLDGLMRPDDLTELFGEERPEEDGDESEQVNSLGGLAMSRLGRVPKTGDTFTWRGLHFEVVDMDGRRVDKLLARREPRHGPTSAA